MKAWTDYPFTHLGDEIGKPAPIREIDVTSYDGNKYCNVIVEKECVEVKAGYIYQRAGRLGEVPCITRRQLAMLEVQAQEVTNA